MVKRNMQDFQGAVQDYDQAIRLNPMSAEAYNNRGSAKALMKNYIGAAEDYTQVIRMDPNSVTAFNNRGNANLMAYWD